MHTHTFDLSKHEGYEVCTGCGTFHSTELLSRDKLYLNNYWNGNSRCRLHQQVANLIETDTVETSKVNFVLRYLNGINATSTKHLLEIAVAPGIFAKLATEIGFKVTGIEPDPKNIDEIQAIAGDKVKLVTGYFPDCMEQLTDNKYACIVGMDVLEHVENYLDFIAAAHWLLQPGGRMMFMSPIILDDQKFRHVDFIAEEHSWIFSKVYLEEVMYAAGFSNVRFDRWRTGHEMVICDK